MKAVCSSCTKSIVVRDEGGPLSYGGFVLQVRAIIEAAMATQKLMLSEFPWDERHRVERLEEVLTPALVVYPDIVASNNRRGACEMPGHSPRAAIARSLSPRPQCADFGDYRRHSGRCGQIH